MRRSNSTLLCLPKLSTLILCILIFSTLGFAAGPDRITDPIVSGQVSSGQLVRLAAGVPMRAQPQYDQGPVDRSFQLSYMTLQTVPSASQQRALNKLLAEQQDRSSPLYHKWLTPEQFADRFALSLNDVQKLTAWLQAQGFTVLKVAPSRNLIAFSGTAAQAEAAFQIQIHKFDVGGEKHFSNTTPASIPSALSGIVAVVGGLNNFRPKPHYQRRSPNYTFPIPGSNPQAYAPYIAPGDIAKIYDINVLYTAGTTGAKEKLAVVGQTDVYLADLNYFRSGFGLSQISASDCATNSDGVIVEPCDDPLFQYVLNGSDVGVDPVGDDLPESDIDLEWSGATARDAQIVFVNSGGTANGVWDAWHLAVTEDLAPVITMSYGICELGEIGAFSADEGYLQEANAQGITFMNSSGDSGAAACDANPPTTTSTYYPPPPYLPAQFGLSVNYPASSPEVTGVGGTMIPIADLADSGLPGQYWSETTNSDGSSVVCSSSGPCIPEIGWNDDQEFGNYCAANPGDTANCDTVYVTGQIIPITGPQIFQEDWWIGSGTGGPSNCIAINGSGECTGGFTQPTWQASLSIPGQTTAVRFTPDISLLSSADFPGYIMCTPQNELPGGTSTQSSCYPGGAAGISNAIPLGSVFGGTSFASPIFAGMVTLLNQYLIGANSTGLGNINAELYSLAATAPTGFHQVTGADPQNYGPGSNIVYDCAGGEPSNQPAALQCPGAVGTTGTMGYLAANADSTTGYNLVTGLGSVDVYNLAKNWGGAKNTASSITILASTAQIYLDQQGGVTLTATVTPSTAVGVVTFIDTNGTEFTVGKAAVSGGVATLTTTNLPAGTNVITASYSGDNYVLSSTTATSTTVTVLVPLFTVTPTTSTGTVLAGQSAVYSFTMTPTTPPAAPVFTSAVLLGCTGLPNSTTTCSVNPPQIAAGAGAGGTPVPVTYTITTAGPNTTGGSGLRRRADKRSPLLPLALPLAGIVMVGFARRRISKGSAIAGLCVSLALLGILVACGGGSSSKPPVTVTVSQGSPASVYPNDTADGWPNQTAQFTATVTNGSSQAVTWAVTTANGGTISATGLYTAPTVAANLPLSVTITATSQSNPTQSGSADEAITPATIPGTYPGITLSANEAGTQGTTINNTVTLTVK